MVREKKKSKQTKERVETKFYPTTGLSSALKD